MVISSTAGETFEAIQSQILSRWGETSLAKFESKTIKILELISESPFIFKSIEGNPDIRKGVIHKNCSVFYEVNTGYINVLFFWDNRQEPIL